MDLTGKHVVYVGGFGGIGQKCIIELLQKGVSHMAIFDLNDNAEFRQSLCARFTDAQLHYVRLDVTRRDDIEAAYKEAIARMGHLDIVINGCGIMNDRYVDLSVQVNLLGVIHSTTIAMDCMDRSKGGRGGVILNISSVFGIDPVAILPIYSATKCAITALTRSFASPLYYERMGISFIAVCPGATETALLANMEDRLLFDAVAPLAAISGQLKRQSAEECARNMIRVLETAANGSVWILDVGSVEEVQFPTLWNKQLTTET